MVLVETFIFEAQVFKAWPQYKQIIEKKKKGNTSTSQQSRMAIIYFFHCKTIPCQVKSCSKSCSTSPKALQNNTCWPHLSSLPWAPAHFHWVEDGERLGSRWQSSPVQGHAGEKSPYSRDVTGGLLMALVASGYRVKSNIAAVTVWMHWWDSWVCSWVIHSFFPEQCVKCSLPSRKQLN